MKRIDVAYCLILNESNQILMVYNGDTQAWSMPGGAVEEGETFEQAAVREVREETGLDIEIKAILAVNECKFLDKHEHAVFLTFSASINGGSIGISHPDEIAVIKWMDMEEANLLMPYHQEGIESLLANNARYTDQGVV